MVINSINIDLYINNRIVEIDKDDFNLQLSDIIYNPSDLSDKTASYSYSFNVPITNNNNIIFDFSNNAAKLNKFNTYYDAKLYVNSLLVFEGLCKISSISDSSYKLNLFVQKQNTLENIFDDSTLNELTWLVDFNGVPTLNSVNADLSTKYFFPFVSYGLFQKLPTSTSGSRGVYTSKTQIDGSNRFYFNSFIPSLNLVEIVKRCFNYKNYTLQGDITTDEFLNNIFLSSNIDDSQDPLYNYGNTQMGMVDINFTFRNKFYDIDPVPFDDPRFVKGNEYYFNFLPKEYQVGEYNNFDHINWVNVLQHCERFNNDNWGTINVTNTISKMYNNGYINIPCDGYYKITFETTYDFFEVPEKLFNVLEYNSSGELVKVDKDINVQNCPIEFRVMRFSASDDIENNLQFELIKNGSYPNEAESVINPAEDNGVPTSGDTNALTYSYYNAALSLPTTTNAVAVDTYPNPNFICGSSQTRWHIGGAVLKNGASWNAESDDYNNVICQMPSYYLKRYNPVTQTSRYSPTDWNKNTLANADEISFNKQELIVKLNKNDMLAVYCCYRVFNKNEDGSKSVTYGINLSSGHLKVEAFAPSDASPKSITDWNEATRFDTQLNLGNFLNSKTKMSSFIQNFIDSFNLSFEQNGNIITINKQKKENRKFGTINIDNRVISTDAEFEPIDYPSAMQVKFDIDTEERGFYNTVPEDKLLLNDWTAYGDYGSDKITISEENQNEENIIQSDFSYNYFQTFKLYDLYALSLDVNRTENIALPIQAKDEWFIEQYKYEESMKEDGRGLAQRMWFRNPPLQDKIDFYYRIPVNTNLKGLQASDCYQITVPSNTKNINGKTYDLSYKNNRNTLLNYYFNIKMNIGDNIVNIKCYLSPQEYVNIKNGFFIKFDDDLYCPLEITYSVIDGIANIKMLKNASVTFDE